MEVVNTETLPQRRCSARSAGKERPDYTLKNAFKVEKVTASMKKSDGRKRARASPNTLPAALPLVAGMKPADVDFGDCSVIPGPTAEECSVNMNSGLAKTDHQRVRETRRMFNTHYLQLIQEEEKRVKLVELKKSPKKNGKVVADGPSTSPVASSAEVSELKVKVKVKKTKAVLKGSEKGCEVKGDVKRVAKRPDLKAISKMADNHTILYPEKRIGSLPGIEVGDQFFSRAEMVVLGLHSHWLNGIDYMGSSKYASMEEYRGYIFPLAVCIVMSGMYEDDVDKCEDVIYTGQGGHDLTGRKHQIKDQKLERGNLALKNNYVTGALVRVVRGHECKSSYCGKVYTYDGLYKVIGYWAERGVSGFTVYKFKLRRAEGQPVLTTSQVYFTRDQIPQTLGDLRGLVCEDICHGQENFAVPATNIIDDPPFAPTDFEYCKSIILDKNVKLPRTTYGCDCKGECVDPRVCSCVKLNDSNFPYVRKDGGRLIEAKALVFECGPGCGCSHTCVNRTSQQGLKYRLEVFRTANKGWAVRSWDTIPAGAPVCEYTGLLTRTDTVDTITSENSYIFDIDCLQTIKGLDGRETRPGNLEELAKFDDNKSEMAEYCIDARPTGNVARFINHSCQPNLFVQCILSSHMDIKMAKVMLFAADTIPPLQELCYDYGYALDSVRDPDGNVVKLACYCGAVGCRKRLH